MIEKVENPKVRAMDRSLKIHNLGGGVKQYENYYNGLK